MSSVLPSIYRGLIPSGVRRPLWFARHFVARFAREAAFRRETLAALRCALGWPVAVARVDGLALHVDLRDRGVGRPMFVQRIYEPVETRHFLQALRPGMVVADVGANIGYYTVIAARAVGPRGLVLAFEPDPYNFEILRRNIARYRLGNVRALNMALGAAQGCAALHRSRHNFGDHRLFVEAGAERETVSVAVETLDDILLAHQLEGIDVVKMDVQGFECSVLKGMERTLAAGRPMIIMSEFCPAGLEGAGGRADEFFELFEVSGFEAFEVGSDGESKVDFREAMTRIAKYSTRNPTDIYINLLFARATNPLVPSR